MNNNTIYFIVDEFHDDHCAQKRGTIRSNNLTAEGVARLHQERRVHFESNGFSIQLRGNGFTALHRGIDGATDHFVTFKMKQSFGVNDFESKPITFTPTLPIRKITMPSVSMAMIARVDDDVVRMPIRRNR